MTPIGRTLTSAALLLTAAMPGSAAALEIAALNQRNELVLFSDTSSASTRVLPVTGTAGKLLGIDVRPADGRLYAVAANGGIYTVSLANGAATRVSKLSVPLERVDHIVVDFNPQADRLRVMASNGQNLRVNVDTGQAIVDKPLAFSQKDRNAGKATAVHAGAYINSFPGASSTQLFNVDSALGVYLVQDPPNDGVLRTVGPTGLEPGTIVEGIDIFTDAADEYHGRAVGGGLLYSFNVARGTMAIMGTVGNGTQDLIDLAILDKR